MLDQFIEEVQKIDTHVDAMQLSEILWLSTIMTSQKQTTSISEKNQNEMPSLKAKQTDSSTNLPRLVTHRIVISSGKENKKSEYSYESDEKSKGVYASHISDKDKFPDIVKQFQALKIKQQRENKKEINESKTADYIATTGLLNPIFQGSKERGNYLSLTIVLDRHESMFLWEDALNHFTKTLLNSNIFKTIAIYEFDSGISEVLLSNINTGRKISVDSPLFKEDKRLTLLFTDVVGKLWRDKSMFAVLDTWSKYSLTAIVSMLPKRMWQKTPLRLGISQYMKPTKFLPKNRDLKSEYSFVEDTIEQNQSKIPVIPYDDTAFKYLSNIIINKKNAWIDSRIFTISSEETNLNKGTKKATTSPTLSARERVERYFSSAIKEARELAIYASVLPLHRKVLNELVRLKSLGKEMDAFSAFYFGGLLDKSASKSNDTYAFYKGVRKELLNYINIDEIKEIYEMLHRVIVDAFGIKKNLLVLLFEHSQEIGSLSAKEKELVELLIEILGSKGKFYKDEIENLTKKSNRIILESNTYKMGSDNGKSDEKPVHTITFDYDFEIAKTPVTFEAYDLYCEDTKTEKPSDNGWGRGKRPVINVSWNDAQAYCKWLSKKTNKEYRLPTEAEWEYACRAGTTTEYSFGDDASELGDYAWYSDNSNGQTHLVGEKKPNPWGLYDMHGNVWEWCEDSWADNYNNTPRDGSAYKDTNTNSKIRRGGSWNGIGNVARSSLRSDWLDDSRFNFVGFRLLRTLP